MMLTKSGKLIVLASVVCDGVRDDITFFEKDKVDVDNLGSDGSDDSDEETEKTNKLFDDHS